MDNFDPSKPSSGLGDTIAKLTNFFKIDKLADAVAKMAGAEGCGCAERRAYLNELFPYETSTRQIRFLMEINIEGQRYEQGTTHLVTKKSPLFPRLIMLAQNGIIEEIV
jgi:hypothetical protein